jgi:hypothetical protein
MPKFTFIAEHKDLYGGHAGNKITHEFEAENLSDVLENFECFIRGAGYVVEGTLDFVDVESTDDVELSDELKEKLGQHQRQGRSEHFYNTVTTK